MRWLNFRKMCCYCCSQSECCSLKMLTLLLPNFLPLRKEDFTSMKILNIQQLRKRKHKIRIQMLKLKNKGNAKLISETTDHVQSYASSLTLSRKVKQIKRVSVHKNYLHLCVSQKIVTAHSMPAKVNYGQKLQFPRQLTPIVSNIS